MLPTYYTLGAVYKELIMFSFQLHVVCVCVLAALRAYLREGNCHLQQTSWGWRSPASSHGVSGLRHTATRYGATMDA